MDPLPPLPFLSGTLPLSWNMRLCTGSDVNVKILQAVQEIKIRLEHVDKRVEDIDNKLQNVESALILKT